MSMNQQKIEDFLTQTMVAVISTVDSAGRARSAPIWFAWDDGAAYMFTSRRTLKWRNIQSTPHASLCIDKRELPYESVIMDGPIQKVERPLFDLVLAMALRYYCEEKGRAFAEGYRGVRPGVAVFKLTPRHIASYVSDP
jgi:uncharacterized pyridoxamine 5'-phosphate oxidase family protein